MNYEKLLREYVKLVLEMPHLELGGATVVDFQIEKLPAPMNVKRALLSAFMTNGFVGRWQGRDVVFSRNGVRDATPDEMETLSKLPDNWTDFIEIAHV